MDNSEPPFAKGQPALMDTALPGFEALNLGDEARIWACRCGFCASDSPLPEPCPVCQSQPAWIKLSELNDFPDLDADDAICCICGFAEPLCDCD